MVALGVFAWLNDNSIRTDDREGIDDGVGKKEEKEMK